MTTKLLAGLLLALPISAHAQSCSARHLQSELAERSTNDQFARAALTQAPNEKSALDLALKVDADNTAWMRRMVSKCGWPRVSRVGKTAAHQAWLLTQHADMAPDYQVYAAQQLKAAVLEHEAEPWTLAVLVDRNRRLQNQPQVYGRQFENESGAIRFFEIEHPEALDIRRKEIGLEPFYCWATKVSGENRIPLNWPSGVLFVPSECTVAAP